jgi:hypothetical protein
MSGRDPREVLFRTLHAPGLEEDDLFIALHGLPAPGPFWGQGRPWARDVEDRPWDEAAERTRRHEELLRKWSHRGARPPGP